MTTQSVSKEQETIVRAHDMAVCLERNTVAEFDQLHLLGMAARLALHLRGVPAVRYELVRQVAIYLLDFSGAAVKPVLELLAEAEFVQLVTEGSTIRTVIPDVPFYERLFQNLGEVADFSSFSEHEQLAIDLAAKLSKSPIARDTIYQYGAERKVVDRLLDIGQESSFLSVKRARGKDIVLSPTYFSENSQAYADLVAGSGSGRVKRLLELLRVAQGWPLELIIQDKRINDTALDVIDLQTIKLLASDGFCPPPAILTKHSGTTHFLFGPRPGISRLPAFKRPIYEAAMALVAAVRQGQLLPREYRIRSPFRLLSSLRDKGFLRSNSEALEQYRQLTAIRVGRLEHVAGDRYQFVLIDNPENKEALNLALTMVQGDEMAPSADEEITIALRQGESYVESLVGRKRLLIDTAVSADKETQESIDEFLLRGAR